MGVGVGVIGVGVGVGCGVSVGVGVGVGVATCATIILVVGLDIPSTITATRAAPTAVGVTLPSLVRVKILLPLIRDHTPDPGLTATTFPEASVAVKESGVAFPPGDKVPGGITVTVLIVP